MNTGKGFFESIDEEQLAEEIKKENLRIFTVGEVIEVKGSRLRVERINRRKIHMKLLPDINQKHSFGEKFGTP